MDKVEFYLADLASRFTQPVRLPSKLFWRKRQPLSVLVHQRIFA